MSVEADPVKSRKPLRPTEPLQEAPVTVATTPGLTWNAEHVQQAGCAVVGNPGATVNADGRNVVFVQNDSTQLWGLPMGSDYNWNTWRQIPGAVIIGDPMPILGDNGLISVLYRSTGNTLYAITQTALSGNFGDPVQIASGCTTDPAVAKNADGRITAVYRGSNGAAWQVSQASISAGTWTAPGTVGGSIIGRAAVALAGDGRLSVVVRGGDNGIWVSTQSGPNGTTSWLTFVSLGGVMISDPVAVPNADQRIAIFYTGGNDAVFKVEQGGNYQFQPAPMASHTSLGGSVVGRPSACLAADGRMGVFGTAKSDKQIFVAEQTTINGPTYAPFTELRGNLSGDTSGGGTPATTVPYLLTVGVIDVFYRGSNGQLWYEPQVQP